MDDKRPKRKNTTSVESYLLSSDSDEDKKTKKRKSKKRTKKQKQIWEMTAKDIKAMWRKQDKIRERDQEILKEAKLIEQKLKKDKEKEKECERREREMEEEKRNFVMKDCKHFSKEELTEMFNRDFEWIDGIFKGKIYCKRHELFKKDHPKYRLTFRDLNYNVSCEVFEQDQLIHLIKLFRQKYDKKNIYKHIDYYWKVLLPEYCLKLFMECYNLDREPALAYLNTIPVPIEKYFKTE